MAQHILQRCGYSWTPDVNDYEDEIVYDKKHKHLIIFQKENGSKKS